MDIAAEDEVVGVAQDGLECEVKVARRRDGDIALLGRSEMHNKYMCTEKRRNERPKVLIK